MRRTFFIVALVALVRTVPVYGHHSFAAIYFADQTISIEGTIEEFDYVNPHSWIHLLAPDKHGQLQKVSAEWAAPGRLQTQGITRETLKPGQHVIVTGSPSRDGVGFKIQLKKIYRPADGWTWSGRGELR